MMDIMHKNKQKDSPFFIILCVLFSKLLKRLNNLDLILLNKLKTILEIIHLSILSIVDI